MLFIYYLSDGAIYQVAIGWNSLEEFYGSRADEMGKVFGAIVLPYDRYVYDNYFRFKVNLQTKELDLIEAPKYLENYIKQNKIS